MPAAKQASRSSGIAFAVIAMIRGRSSAAHRSRIRRDASRPSSSGICTSISTTSYGCRSSAVERLEAVRQRRPRDSRAARAGAARPSGSPRCPRPSRIRSERRAAGAGPSTAQLRPCRSGAWPASSSQQRVVELRGLDRLRQLRRERRESTRRAAGGRATSGGRAAGLARPRCRRISPARASPSMSGIIMSSTATSNASPRSISASASTGSWRRRPDPFPTSERAE